MNATAEQLSRGAAVVGHFINGAYVEDAGRRLPVTNPATGAVQREVALASKETVNTAIAAASEAFPQWRDTPPQRRAQVMFRYRELLQQNAQAIAAAITEEHGKVLDDAMGEFQRGVEVVEYA
ncbi:MAG: aldehyde dehydrogenase family protein, partial [Pseudomonadota bacterium]